MGYTATSIRAITQFYVDGKIAGIPVDLRWQTSERADELVGWFDESNMSEEEIRENDKSMRNRGFMKGPASIVLGDNATMRESQQAIRKIVGTFRLDRGDHWLRFKDVTETAGTNQFDQDYLELVPTSVLSNPSKPEDIY